MESGLLSGRLTGRRMARHELAGLAAVMGGVALLRSAQVRMTVER